MSSGFFIEKRKRSEERLRNAGLRTEGHPREPSASLALAGEGQMYSSSYQVNVGSGLSVVLV